MLGSKVDQGKVANVVQSGLYTDLHAVALSLGASLHKCDAKTLTPKRFLRERP